MVDETPIPSASVSHLSRIRGRLFRLTLPQRSTSRACRPRFGSSTWAATRSAPKWLKDRKGRQLTYDDLTHYQYVVAALAETISLMREIDEVIEAHGGWPIG